MKFSRALKIVAIILAFCASANAQVTARDLTNVGMPPEQAKIVATIGTGSAVLNNATWLKGRNAANTANINLIEVDASDNTRINSSASDELILQLEDDANRLISFTAATDAALVETWGDGGTTATQSLTVRASTADADDDSSLILCGGGGTAGTRGACITLPGEEVAGGADITYNAGTSDTHLFNIAGTTALTVASGDTTVVGNVNLSNNLIFSGTAKKIVAGPTSLSFRDTGDTATNLGIADAGAITIRSTFTSSATSDLGWAVVAGANTACNTTCTSACVFGVNTAATEADIVGCADATADECLCAGAS